MIPSLDLNPCNPTPPVPVFPSDGFAGSILPVPAIPPTGDPFTAGGPSIYETYGLAGGDFRLYDQGCTPDLTALLNNNFADTFHTWGEVQVAVVARLGYHTYQPTTWLGVFDTPLQKVSAALLDGLFSPLAPIALLVCCLAIALMLRKAQATRVVAAAVFAVLAIGIAYAAANGPVKAATLADGVIPEVAAGVNHAMTGGQGTTPEAAAVGPLVDDILYRQWIQGELGCVDCDVAREYGPALFNATAFTWAEAKRAETDPAVYKQLTEQKNQQWTDTAAKIKTDNPAAYEHLTGARSTDRLMAGISAWALTFLPAVFLVCSFALICGAFLIWRVVVMTAPAWALLGLIPSTAGALSSVGWMLAAAVVNSVAYAAGVAVYVNVLGVICDPALGLNWLLSGALAVGWTVLVWFLLKPFKKLTRVFRGDPVAHAQQSAADATDTIKKGAVIAGGYVAGRKVSDLIDHDQIRLDIPERRGRPEGDVTVTPTTVTSPSAPPIRRDTLPPGRVVEGQIVAAPVRAALPPGDPEPVVTVDEASRSRYVDLTLKGLPAGPTGRPEEETLVDDDELTIPDDPRVPVYVSAASDRETGRYFYEDDGAPADRPEAAR